MTTSPRFWIGTSWKMNKTLAEALTFASGLKAAEAQRDPRIQRFIVPPFTAVREVKAMLANSSVKVGARTCIGKRPGMDRGGFAPDADRLQSRSGRTGAFRAARVFWRDK